MAGKPIKKKKNKPLLYIHHLDLYKLQCHMQRSTIVKQVEQAVEMQQVEKDNVENKEKIHRIVEERRVTDQLNIQTDFKQTDVSEQNNIQTDFKQTDVSEQNNIQTDFKQTDVSEQNNIQTDFKQTDVSEQNNVQTDFKQINVTDQHDIQIDKTEENQSKQEGEQFVESSSRKWQKKRFKDMENEEKIYFLLNRPHYIPSVKCVVKTGKASYVGIIVSYEKGVLQMVMPNYSGNFKLNIEEIVSIRMMGL